MQDLVHHTIISGFNPKCKWKPNKYMYILSREMIENHHTGCCVETACFNPFVGHEMNFVDQAQNEKGVEFFLNIKHRVKVLLYQYFVLDLLIDTQYLHICIRTGVS